VIPATCPDRSTDEVGLREDKRHLLDQAQLPDEVELHAEPGRLVVQATRRPRTGWAEAARAMSEARHDGLLDEPTGTRFDRKEWDWR